MKPGEVRRQLILLVWLVHSVPLIRQRKGGGASHCDLSAAAQVLVQGLLLQLWAPLRSVGGIYRRLRKALVDLEDFVAILCTPLAPPDGTLLLPPAWLSGRPLVVAPPQAASARTPAADEAAAAGVAASHQAGADAVEQRPPPEAARCLAGGAAQDRGLLARQRRRQRPEAHRKARSARSQQPPERDFLAAEGGASAVPGESEAARRAVMPAPGPAAGSSGASGTLPGMHVEFRNVSFSYGSQTQPGLEQQQQQQQQQVAGLTFSVLPGECVAVVGPPGALLPSVPERGAKALIGLCAWKLWLLPRNNNTALRSRSRLRGANCALAACRKIEGGAA